MSSKREERKQRAEEHRVDQERERLRKIRRSRALAVVILLVLIAAGFFATRRRDGDERDGRVWSAAHGHWHDK
jgi:hypothetical protein